uniref:Thymidine kinase n=2 Tax=Rattus norvegicus TaxID=10116 RepID=A0ABK0M2M4_RAT
MSYINLPTVLPISPSKTRGQIQVILGPMFSGKSTELMRRVRRFQIAQYKCLVIKYAKDTRYSNSFSTHDRSANYLLAWCPWRPGKGIRFPTTGIGDHCKLPHGWFLCKDST